MLESEAKEKFCPHFEGWIANDESVDRHYKCKGSACMMWVADTFGRMTPGDIPGDVTVSGCCGLVR